jgi:hypothetical protein
MPGKKSGQSLHFPAVPLAELRSGRIGKHNKMVSDILNDLKKLDEYSALKIDLAAAGYKKADLRSALHRAAKKNHADLVTASDEKHLYVFRRRSKSP